MIAFLLRLLPGRLLRHKVMLAQAPLGAVLALFGVLAVLSADIIGRQSRGVLDADFRSVLILQRMIEAMERVNAGVLMVLVGEVNQGSQTVTEHKGEVALAFTDHRREINDSFEARATDELQAAWARFEADVAELVRQPPGDAATARYLVRLAHALRRAAPESRHAARHQPRCDRAPQRRTDSHGPGAPSCSRRWLRC